ncbi:chemotaxis signal transduction protein CheV [Helicobacter muridarum]|uniref:Chemotaxis signal transduction protein CheV n=1 Tax=Helicobacter muridarum TaxID=216 RepID=A0A377PU15_9HELI|nr:chemotaxis protein [Helicobacter muridarum]TLD99557.1 chemotaxis signal transduction protein CheV [Helicobacter muridarum]STQ85894.1 chemotaxis signal transduction protein CheV [Helicobacter muridarum]
MISNIDKTTSLHLNNEAQFLCFTLEDSDDEKSNQLYAMNVFKIREIIYYDGELTETAGENDGIILGFLTVRGESIPLVDMRRWLYFNSSNPKQDLREYSVDSINSKNLVVICNFSQCTVGLKILGVRRIIQRNWDSVIVGSEYGFDGNNKITATTKFDDGSVVQIMDVERMIVDAFPIFSANHELQLDSLSSIKSDKVVLIAEDSKPAQHSLQIIMERLELKYFTFPNGKALLEYLSSPGVINTVGAIITDLEMPLISGFEVLKHIRDNENTKNIPVIVNSSMSNDSNIEKAHSLKANAFITKSNPSEIEDALRKALAL